MFNYLKLMQQLCDKAVRISHARPDRTQTGTVGTFGHELRFDLTQKFPLLPYRELNFKDIMVELAWFLRGDTNIAFLEQHGCMWWSNQCDDNGNVGPLYGQQWRGCNGLRPNVQTVDQIGKLIRELKADPYSRRHVVSVWDQNAIPPNSTSYHDNVQNGFMAIAPCHQEFQCYVEEENGINYLSLKFNMRSSDTFLGLPANIASYAGLTHILAAECDMKPKELIYSGGDVHLYWNHIAKAQLLLSRANEVIADRAYVDGWKPIIPGTDCFSDYVKEITSDALLPEFIMPKGINWENPDIDAMCAGLMNYHPLEKIVARMAR